MVEEKTRARLAEVENQMTKIVTMMAEMKAFILTSRGLYPVTPNVGTSNARRHPKQRMKKRPRD